MEQFPWPTRKKDYFDFIFSVTITVFTTLLVLGQIVFLGIGLTFGIADWDVQGILAIGFGAFGVVIGIALSMTLFAAWRYWSFDSEGVTNGNLFHKRRFAFSEIELVETKIIIIGSKPFVTAQENLCFTKDRKTITIPTYRLSMEELEWLKQQVSFKK